MKTLEDIRSIVQRETDLTEHESIINWCNDANMDFGTVLNVPGTTFSITVNTTDLEYTLPTDLKEINRMWLQSDYDAGTDREIRVPYRIYNGKIKFPTPFSSADTLKIDYYKFLTVFDDISDAIDLPDRFLTIYTTYCFMRYYSLLSTQEKLTQAVAQRNYDRAANAYQMVKNQVIQNYSFTTPDLTVLERW